MEGGATPVDTVRAFQQHLVFDTPSYEYHHACACPSPERAFNALDAFVRLVHRIYKHAKVIQRISIMLLDPCIPCT